MLQSANHETRVAKERGSPITAVLEDLYVRYNRRELIPPDPLQFVYRYDDPADMEIAGLLASSLAYGRVEQIERDVGNLLAAMGRGPARFVRDFDGRGRERLSGFKHRFTTGEDIAHFLELLRAVLAEFGSIEKYFLAGYSANDANAIPALMRFCDGLADRFRRDKKESLPKGVAYLFPSPRQGSCCKRLNLFLRWMVRRDDVDSGLWASVDKRKLIVPLDVHMARLCRILGLHNHKTVSLTTAIQVTEGFAKIEPDDPVKYDFALSRIGIVEDCTGRYREGCEVCRLFDWCRERWRK